jgi:ABC-type iron transport system FetAB ATPase subunit
MPNTHTILARAMFGTPAAQRDPVPGALDTARAIDSWLVPGHIALITGPSGAGKSTILRELARELRERDHAAIAIDPARLRDSTTVIDALNAPLATTLSLLATCGLADATILETPIRHLSAGQRWRLALAAGLRRAQLRRTHCTLLIDELGSALDATTARCICRTLRRFIEPRPIRAICATHDHTLMDFLCPSLLCIQPLHAPAILSTRKAPAA